MKKSIKLKIVGTIMLGSSGLLLASFQNCAKLSVSDMKSDVQASSTPINPNGPPTMNHILKTMKPALAVRGLACLMCHADIRSNIITDFGYGNPFYLGTGRPLDGNTSNQSDQSWYNNDAHTWQSATQIAGTVFVPNQIIPADVQSSMSLSDNTPLSIAAMLATPYNATWNWDNSPAEQNSPMLMKVTPPTGQPQVVSLGQISITSPSESDVLALAAGLATNSSVRVGSSDPSPFLLAGGPGAQYLKNDESQMVQCPNGDIVVNGTLYLRNLQVNAKAGCRLYVTGTVFIENEIIYSDSDSTQNLQITSANAIIMGIGLTQLQGRWNDRRAAAISDPKRSFEDRFQQVLQEAQNIGSLADAGDTNPRTSIDFHGLLLNAPIVESRYLGSVQGTIVAQLALFALENFHFQFDEVFNDVDVFPLLTTPILTAQ